MTRIYPLIGEPVSARVNVPDVGIINAILTGYVEPDTGAWIEEKLEMFWIDGTPLDEEEFESIVTGDVTISSYVSDKILMGETE